MYRHTRTFSQARARTHMCLQSHTHAHQACSQDLERGVHFPCHVVRVGDSGIDKKTGGGDGGGRVEDVAIFIRSDKNGQDQE